MNISCEQIDELLLEGDLASLERAAHHARTCDACRDRLAAWNDISATARSLRTTWESDLLWPRIERGIRNERRAARVHLWQIAAAIALTIGLAAAMWRALQVRAEQKAFDRAILRESAVEQVEKSERAHVAAIDQLEKLAEPKLEQETPLMVSYKEKLMLLDDAIAECQTNIQQNRQNAHLRRQLLAIYSEKQRTLQDVLREGSNASNQ